MENIKSLDVFCEQLKNEWRHDFFPTFESQICQNIEYYTALLIWLLDLAEIFQVSSTFCFYLSRLPSSSSFDLKHIILLKVLDKTYFGKYFFTFFPLFKSFSVSSSIMVAFSADFPFVYMQYLLGLVLTVH